ncbi:putative protein without homology [Propionibacterium freudenreichii subsp. shermanii]|nr:putative protein without homology [Propionibacterium freudenreichii subsp. shermanii]
MAARMTSTCTRAMAGISFPEDFLVRPRWLCFGRAVRLDRVTSGG